MSNLDLKKGFSAEDVRDIELTFLKSKIIEAIRFSEHYWMIFKSGTFGIATIIDLKYKKSYIEILFFTKTDVVQKGVPLVEISTPTETRFNFSEILANPELDKDGFVNPKKIIEKVDTLISKEINYHLNFLNKELQLINENFENYPIQSNLFFRKIMIYFPDYVIKMRINLENYPEIPRFSERKQIIIKRFKEPLVEKMKGRFLAGFKTVPNEELIEKIKIFDHKKEISIEKGSEPFMDKVVQRFNDKFGELVKDQYSYRANYIKERDQIIKEDNLENIEIIKKWDIKKPPHVVELIKSILRIKEGSQHIILEDVSISNEIFNLNFELHRGQSIGIFCEAEEEEDGKINTTAIYHLYQAITGSYSNFSGYISIFNKEIKPNEVREIKGVSIVSDRVESKMNRMKIKKALTYKFRIIGKRKNKKRLIKRALDVTGLLHRKNEKISQLSTLEHIQFSISRALLKMENILLISIPSGEAGRLECEQFCRYIERIKKKFHVIIIIQGPKDIVSHCDKIITIRNKQADIGTIDHFISKVPQSGEIITIELENPDQEALKKMLEIDSAIFIEERKNERYKIYCTKENPEKIIMKLINSVGDFVYNFKRHKATLEEYLEFVNLTQNVI